MPRAARSVLAGVPLHVVQRGINRQLCFFEERDYLAYLGYLGEFSALFGCSVHAYCLMSNHVHLLLTPRAADACALLMKRLGQCYVQRVNHRLGRSGTLWEGRFHSCLVNSDRYVLACYRYIELNPVRAGMVSAPGDYRWSSHIANTSVTPGEMLHTHPSFLTLGEVPEVRATAYKSMCGSPVPERELEEIRRATRVGYVVGMRRRSRGRPFRAWGLSPFIRARRRER